MGAVLVYCVASLNGEASASAPAPPPAYQPNPRNLTFAFAGGRSDPMWYWCVSARCFFRSPDSAPARASKKKHRCNGILDQDGGESGAATAPEVPRGKDRTRQRGVPSASLLRIARRKELDFFPGQRVIGKMVSPPGATDDDGNAAGRVGIVKSLSCKDQTVCVSWITAAPAGEEPIEVVDNVMSRYDLARSSDHGFFYGDIVVRLRPRASSAVEAGGGGGTEETAPVRRSNKATNDLSCVGHVVDLCDAKYIHVKWGDGTTSKVLFHEIAFIKPRSVDAILHEMGDWVHDDEDEDNSDSGTDAEHGPVGGTAIIGKFGSIILAMIQTLSAMFAQGKMYMLSRSMASAPRAKPAMIENIQTCSSRIGDDGDCHMEEAAAAAACSNGKP